MRLLALSIAIAIPAACNRAQPRPPGDPPPPALTTAVTADAGPPDAGGPADAAPDNAAILAAWQGTWVIPDYDSLRWSLLEVTGDAVQMTTSQDYLSGTQHGKLTVEAPCLISVKISSPTSPSGSDVTIAIPFVFEGSTLRTGGAVALRRGHQMFACGGMAFTLEGSTCHGTNYLGEPIPASCHLDGDLFHAGARQEDYRSDDLIIPMHGDAGWTERPPAIRAATLAEARQVYDEKAAARFDFTGAGIPVGFAGIKLGDRHVGPIYARFPVFEGLNAQLTVRTDGRGVVDQLDLWFDTDPTSLMAKLDKRFGPHKRNRWVGPSSQIIVEPSDPYSGSPNVPIVIVPSGETHVCGKQDGFSKFYREFERAVGAKDWSAVAAMMWLPQKDWVDSEGEDTSTTLRTAAELAAAPEEVFRHELLRMIPTGVNNPTCDLVGRRYVIRYGSERLSPAVYATRGSDGTWLITDVGHPPHDVH